MSNERTTRVMRLRRDGQCVTCDAPLPAGTSAQWDRVAKTTTCLGCVEGAPSTDAPAGKSSAKTAAAGTPPPNDEGVAGASARREYERRRDKREAGVRAKHPRIGGLILALSDEPRSTTAWATGAEGERKVGEALDQLRSERVVVLHDRRIPRSTANIDHLVVAPSGVHVIDTKRYKGRVEIRPSGSIFRPGPNLLYVGGRNQTALVEKMARQVEVVLYSLSGMAADVDLGTLVRPALCFVDAEWGWFAKPEMLRGVRISGPKSLLTFIGEDGPLTTGEILEIGTCLADALEPS